MIELSERFLFQRLSWWFDLPHQDQWQRHGIWRRNEMKSVSWVEEVFSNDYNKDRKTRSFLHCYPHHFNKSLHLACMSVVFQPCTARQKNRQADRQAGRQTDKRQRERTTERQKDRKIERQTDRTTDRQTDGQMHRQIRPIEKCNFHSLDQPVKQSANPLADILTYLSADALRSSLMCVNVWLGVTSSASSTLQK